MRKIIFCALCALALISCNKTPPVQGNKDIFAETGNAMDITPFSASLHACFKPTGNLKTMMKGIVCSTRTSFEDNYTVERSTSDESVMEFVFEIEDLQPETTYYFRSYVDYKIGINNQRDYGEVKSFTTPSMESIITTEEPVRGAFSALMRGRISMDIRKIPKSYRVAFSQSRIDPQFGERKYLGDEYTELKEDGTFEAKFRDSMTEDAAYCYIAKIEIGSKSVYGEEKTFYKIKFVPSKGEVIDMGLSVKWGSCNVGATNPEEAGDYFAWGETAPKTEYTKDNYLYNPETPGDLPVSADAANVVLGANWRMPTDSDYGELFENSLTEWGQYGTTYGRLFISKKNNNTLFFPAAGYKVYDNRNELDTQGHYWTRNYIPDNNAARFCSFDSFYYGTKYTSGMFEGYSVRAVYVK